VSQPGPDVATLFAILQGLKRVPRTGWLDRGVPAAAAESVADHSYLTALIAWIHALDDPELDADRVLKLAMIHDLAEAIVGDAPPYEPHEVPDRADAAAHRAFFSVRHVRTPENRAAKQQAEAAAFAHLAGLLPPIARVEFTALWKEYETRSTPEARFVKEVDTLEAYLESRHYAERDPDLPLWGFTDMAGKEITHPTLAAIRDASRQDR
jgi:putative hydrolases of HD superfamily